MTTRLNRLSLLNRAIGILWFVLCLCAGSSLIDWSFHTRRSASEVLFPLYLAIWCTLFFVGRALLARGLSPQRLGLSHCKVHPGRNRM